jgi:NADH dehydrogenase [ubiquinone] 1 alpha subcomplex assembly factor 7
MSVAQFMAAALYDPRGGYYRRAPSIGANGDFITAPEVSQMFGELVGLWCAHEWEAMERPSPFHLIELGPGRGTLMADAWRASRIAPGFRSVTRIHFIEINSDLRRLQREALAQVGADANWCERFEAIPSAYNVILANEFFDCLPIRQFVRTRIPDNPLRWRERLLGVESDGLRFGLAQEALPDEALLPPRSHAAPEGSVAEIAPALPAWIDLIAARLHANPGRMLIIDYGGDGMGDTLQALKAHGKVDPLESPGEADLTAHVDFGAIKRLACASALDVHGPVSQGDWLRSLGIEARAQALSAARPDRADRIARELERLTGNSHMGGLFQVLCLSSPHLPPPAGL